MSETAFTGKWNLGWYTKMITGYVWEWEWWGVIFSFSNLE